MIDDSDFIFAQSLRGKKCFCWCHTNTLGTILGRFPHEKDKVTSDMTGMIAEESATYSAVLWESRGVCACLGNQAFPSFIIKTEFLWGCNLNINTPFVYFVFVCILSKSNNLLLQFDETGPWTILVPAFIIRKSCKAFLCFQHQSLNNHSTPSKGCLVNAQKLNN